MFALQLDLVNGISFFRPWNGHKRFQKIRSIFEQAPLIYNQGEENDTMKTLRLCGDDRWKDFLWSLETLSKRFTYFSVWKTDNVGENDKNQ